MLIIHCHYQPVVINYDKVQDYAYQFSIWVNNIVCTCSSMSLKMLLHYLSRYARQVLKVPMVVWISEIVYMLGDKKLSEKCEGVGERINMSGVGWMGDKWHCVHTAPTCAACLSRGTTSGGGMARSPHLPPSPPLPHRVSKGWHNRSTPFLKQNTSTTARACLPAEGWVSLPFQTQLLL